MRYQDRFLRDCKFLVLSWRQHYTSECNITKAERNLWLHAVEGGESSVYLRKILLSKSVTKGTGEQGNYHAAVWEQPTADIQVGNQKWPRVACLWYEVLETLPQTDAGWVHVLPSRPKRHCEGDISLKQDLNNIASISTTSWKQNIHVENKISMFSPPFCPQNWRDWLQVQPMHRPIGLFVLLEQVNLLNLTMISRLNFRALQRQV